jgi:hypothetical protein
VYAVLRLGVNARHGDALEQSQRHEPLSIVAEPVILVCECGAAEYPLRVHEVEAVVLQVPLALRLVPRIPHGLVYRQRVYASRLYGCCRLTFPVTGTRPATHAHAGASARVRVDRAVRLQ